MRIGVVTKNPNSWCSQKIIEAFRKKGAETLSFNLSEVVARVGYGYRLEAKGNDLAQLGGVLVRPIGPGSLDEIIFRIDVLHRLERLGIPLTNSPKAIERAADKYFTLTLLEDAGVPVPKTLVTESLRESVRAFPVFKTSIVKPIFGSRGIGITKMDDAEAARRVFRLLNYNHFVLYLQEYIRHGGRDIRCLTLGDRVIAAMYRLSDNWKTNVAQGARPLPFKPDEEVERLAVKAATAVGCEVAGIDLMESERGLLVHEINSQPGFNGLQLSSGINIAGAIAEYVLEKAKR